MIDEYFTGYLTFDKLNIIKPIKIEEQTYIFELLKHDLREYDT